MIKQINKLLKLVGFNLVRAKRKKIVTRSGIRFDETKYMGESEWQNTPPVSNPDECVEHADGTDNVCIGHKSGLFVGNPNAAFVPVDIGDGCPGGHKGLDIVPGDNGAYAEKMSRVKQSNPNNEPK